MAPYLPPGHGVQQHTPVAEYAPAAQVSLRIRLLLASATSALPLASTATSQGFLNEASVPAPSAKSYIPLPASVVTTPTGVTRRMRWLPKSATKMSPLAITDRPRGLLKAAPAPVPSVNAPVPLPASRVTAPVVVTLRMR